MDNSKRTRTEVYSRVNGYLRPTDQWNDAKVSEFKNRKMFDAENYIKDNE
jgi:ribonucleoside-triphosphate reductase